MPGGNPSTPGGGGGKSGSGGIPAKVYYTVVFDSQGGSPVIPQRLAPGGVAVRPDDPTKLGYLFEDWYLDADGSIPYNFSSPVRREKLTLYAKWTDIGEYFAFTIDTSLGDGNNTFSIATGGSASSDQQAPFDWDIYVDGGDPVRYTDADESNNSIDISAQLAKDGIHTIIIAEHDITTEGNSPEWFRAFGNGWGDENNRRKLATLVSPLPTIGLCVRENDDGTYNAGDAFGNRMFVNCDGSSFEMGKDFNLPQNITITGYRFCREMFLGCSGASFTMGKNFNLPKNITVAVDAFCRYMFYGCSGAAFAMNDVFNLPKGITDAEKDFCSRMFDSCSGGNFTMNDVFNLPQGIMTAGDGFCFRMFDSCSGGNFTMNDVFNLPQDITVAGKNFATEMFGRCSGSSFTVNDKFKFPQRLADNLGILNDGAFYRMFYEIRNSQSVAATGIINGLPVPMDDRDTFYSNNGSSVWGDCDSLPANWK
jgi:uncharacterized repeat protein (TIGR02543 family)